MIIMVGIKTGRRIRIMQEKQQDVEIEEERESGYDYLI